MPRKPERQRQILPELLKEPKRWKALLGATGVPKATLTNNLRRMRKQGIVEAVLVDDKVRWQLTPQGKVVALEQVGKKEELQRVKKDIYSVAVRELYPNAWWDLVERTAKNFQIDQYRPKDLSRAEFKRNLLSYSGQIKPALIELWPTLTNDYVETIARILSFIVVMRALLPSRLDNKTTEMVRDALSNMSKRMFIDLDKRTEYNLLATIYRVEGLARLAELSEKVKVERSKQEPKADTSQ